MIRRSISAETHQPTEDTDRAVDEFVSALAAWPVAPDVYNFYAASARCCDNLAAYLTALRAQPPRLMLVGEAPGYRGCRLTGVPFTSEHILLHQPVPGRDHMSVADGARAQREATATIVWQVLTRIAQPPLLWNAYPFHPFRPNQPASNRRPRSAEITQGRAFLLGLLDLFSGVRLVAVGRCAEAALAPLDRPFHTIRHPSHGGKRAFTAGLLRLAEA